METELDFSKGKRAADVPHLAKLQATAASGKTRITIMLDNDVLEAFRARADAAGTGYQTAINEALRGFLDRDNAPLTLFGLMNEVTSVRRQSTPFLVHFMVPKPFRDYRPKRSNAHMQGQFGFVDAIATTLLQQIFRKMQPRRRRSNSSGLGRKLSLVALLVVLISQLSAHIRGKWQAAKLFKQFK